MSLQKKKENVLYTLNWILFSYKKNAAKMVCRGTERQVLSVLTCVSWKTPVNVMEAESERWGQISDQPQQHG